MKPTPPSHLNKELLGVWNAWCYKGDKEVIRESAAKGSNIELAYTFLANRQQVDDTVIKETFKEEVITWMMQLLLRKQIFRASHVVTNIKLDPIVEFTRIFVNTFDDDLRDYLGDHLDKLNELKVNHKETWNLLNTLKNNRLYLQNLNENFESLNIETLEKKTFDWKCEIGTTLFFKIYDPVLKSFITPKSAWWYLLEQNNTEFIKLWISLFYSKKIDLNFIHLDHQVFDLLTDIFSNLEITEELIDLIGDFDCLDDSKIIILNEFSKFGVFCQEEKCNVIKILERLILNGNILNLHKILSQSTSNISLFQFNEMLIDHCVSNDLHTVLNWCNIDMKPHTNVLEKYHSKQLDLLSYLSNHHNLSERVGFSENLLRVSLFLADSLNNFLVSNPLILLALMVLSGKDINLLELLKCDNTEIKLRDFVVSSQTVTKSLSFLPFLNTIVNPPLFKNATYQDLLNAHNFYFNFKLEGDAMPNYNSKCLVDKFAYKKTLNYTFYLKHGRPSFATKIFILNNKSKRSDYEENVNKKILKFVARNYSNKDILASCTAFLEMIGLNSKRMRIYIKAAEILHLSDEYNSKEIQNMLLNVSTNPELFCDALEKVLFKSCSLTNLDFLGSNLIEEIKKHELVVEFSKIHCLKLPQLFLHHCTRNNLWLLFLLFIQIFNYPLADVQKLLQNFRSGVLVEHLMHGISQNIRVDDRRNLMMNDRDSRKYYLSRVGVFQNVDVTSSSTYSSSFGSYGSTGSSTGSCDFSENENFDFVTDLLQILIKCHNCVDPPKALLHACHVYKNPLFSVLAASYEPDSIITNWLIWLSISCGIEVVGFNVDNVLINPDGVADCLVGILKSGYHKILYESFQIFLPDNPLIYFIDFLCECIGLNFNENVTKKLKLFEKERKQQGKCNVIVDGDYEMNFLINQHWLESTTTKLLAVTIQNNFSSRHNQLQFLKFLIDIKIENYFTVEFPNFQKLFDVLSHLLENNCCDIKLDLSVIFNKEVIEKEILNYVDKMLLEKHYNCCYKIGNILKISTDFIAIRQCQDLFENRNGENFWSGCDEILKLKNVEAHAAIDFFRMCSTELSNKNELYQVLKIACDWANRYNLNVIYDLEWKMWLAYMDIEGLEDKFVTGNFQKLLYSEIKQKLQFFQNCFDHCLNEVQILNLNSTIQNLLNDGNLWQALKISTIFKHQHKDLDMIILCCNLAEGLLKPDQLNVEQRLLLVQKGNFRNTSYRRHRALLSSKGYSSINSGYTTTLSMLDQDDVEIQDVLTFLDVLSNHIKNGFQISRNILLTYRISANTEKTYEDVFHCKNSMDMIKEALNGNCINKLEVVNDFRLLFNWSEEETADFLSRELITSISEHINLNLEPTMIWNFNLDADFHVILQVLLENCSVLGLKIFSYVDNMHKAEIKTEKSDININNIRIMVELLIRSHDCFTADCNMEGISTILRKCQVINELLHTIGGWKSIVRLLTGVARYTEMNYVFHILKENDQFEFLLCKGNRRDNHLKLALLKYIKKYCPENRELYRMVALHFTLFSEIAELWEEEAKSVIRNLIAISKLEMQNNGLNVETERFIVFTNTDGTKLCLNRAMVNYTHATEYHLQGKKLTKAMNSAKQAELLALQISLLKGLAASGTAICIMRINEDQILFLISNELSFYQSLILAEAYNYKIDWSSVLFEQIVVHNQSSYLDNFLTSFTLTDNIVMDISKKFLSLKAISDTTIKNMKEIVKRCTDVCTKYRMASELGFYDLVEDLLAGSQLAYLKDTAFKTGFRN